jgi:ribosomal protein S18 acetylase RimI-like enzyme
MAVDAIGEKAWTIVLDGNQRAIRLYESEGFKEIERFKGDNAGYPCTCLRIERA